MSQAKAASGAVVVTTIASPNAVLRELSAGCVANAMPFIAIGDAKSPDDFALDGCDYYGLERQADLAFATAHWRRQVIMRARISAISSQ